MKIRLGNGLRRTIGILIVAGALAGCDGAASNSSAGDSTNSMPSSTGGASSVPSSVAESSVTLSWSAPTENTDGSALTNLAGFNIYYGTSPSSLSQKISLDTVGNLTYVIDNLKSGTWYFQVMAVNAAGVESSPSGVVSAAI